MIRFIVRLSVICFVLILLTGCSWPRMWIVDNSVIATYNRHSGQFEIVWERHSHGSGLDDTLSVAKSHNY